jgi:hypothetical protein
MMSIEEYIGRNYKKCVRFARDVHQNPRAPLDPRLHTMMVIKEREPLLLGEVPI